MWRELRFLGALWKANLLAAMEYLSLPRPVLLHVLASRSLTHGLGDLSYGLISFALAGRWTVGAVLRFLGGTLGQQATNALITLALYPITLFDGTAKLLVFTVVPAAFVGAVPAELVREFSWPALAELLAAAGAFLGLALFVFHRGLRRYESGSAIQTQV